MCEAEPTITYECAEGLEETEDGSGCILTETQNPICPAGTHLNEESTFCVVDHNGERSLTDPTCSASQQENGYSLKLMDDGRFQCVKTTISQPTEEVVTCEVGEHFLSRYR
jgi:hypothetical protein